MNSPYFFTFVLMSLKNSISLKLTFNKRCFSFNNSSKPPKKDKDHWKVILGRGGPNQHSHRLAAEHIKSGQPVTAKIINDIFLSRFCNIHITEDMLKDLLNTPRFVLNDLNKSETIKIIKDKVGSPSDKNQIPGIYIFKHKDTGDKYVGSSSQLAIRLDGYLKEKHRAIGLLIPILYKEELSNFSLEVIPLYNSYDFRSEIVLEQYYLLDPSFNLNTVRVANKPSGSNAKPLYMYNRDKSILYYSSMQQKDFINNLNIHYVTFNKHLKMGTYYLGKYALSQELVLTAKYKGMSISELSQQLAKDREKFKRNRGLAPLN